ncbi:MAG: hypothetical protein ACKVKG_19770, partial [Alphaproteobacteria bacterium]
TGSRLSSNVGGWAQSICLVFAMTTLIGLGASSPSWAASKAIALETKFAEHSCWRLRVSGSPGGEVWVIGKVPSEKAKKKPLRSL